MHLITTSTMVSYHMNARRLLWGV